MKDSLKLPSEIREALLSNNVNTLKGLRLLRGKVYGKQGKTLLHCAAKYCDDPQIPTYCVQSLKIKPNSLSKRGKLTALHVSCTYGKLAIAKYLASLLETSLDTCDIYGETALGLAAKHNCTELAVFLHQKGSSLQCKNKLNWTPLHWASKNGNQFLVNYLLTAGADPRSVNSSFENSLHLAVESGSVETVQLLLVHVFPLIMSRKGTILHHSQSPEMMNFILLNTALQNLPKLGLLLDIKAPANVIMQHCVQELQGNGIFLVFRNDREDVLQEICIKCLIGESTIQMIAKLPMTTKCKIVIDYWARWQVIKKIIFVYKYTPMYHCINRLPRSLIREIISCL